jgi:SAM-dependent methyltransferase
LAELADIRDNWNRAAREDAMFYILTLEGKEGGGWDPGEFFARGDAEIKDVLGWMKPARWDRALDFGCGVGRLTKALAKHFDHVDGVDVSKEMIRRARQMVPEATFHTNSKPHLRLFDAGTFDFVYTAIVLQHMPHDLQKGYIAEFLRVLRPGGLAVFELPEGPTTEHQQPWLSMYGTDRATVVDWIYEAGGKLRATHLTEHSDGPWLGYSYAVSP